MPKLFFVLTFFTFVSAAFSQQIPSQQVMEEAMKSYDEGKYDLAISQFRTIHENDSNYQWMLAELAMTYMQKGENDSAIMIADQGLKLKGDNVMHLMRTKGTAYDNIGDTDRAIAVYKQAIEKFPFEPLLYFNLGITYYRLENYEDALACFQESATGNPYHASSHRMLAIMAARQKMYTRALLSLETFLALEPNSQRSNALLVYLENFSGNYLDTTMGQFIEPIIDNSLFEEVDHYIKAKIVLTNRYPSMIDFNANLVKQTQMVFDVLPLDQMQDDFWVKMYYPFFQSIKQGGHLVPLLNTLLLSTNAESVQKYFSKNEKELKAFYSTGSQLSYIKQKRQANLDGEEKIYDFDYFDNGKIYSIGDVNDQDEETGPWEYFYSNGMLQAKGSFEKGNKVGQWRYFSAKGDLESTETYVEGKLNGYYIGYFDNGNKSVEIPYKEGEVNGLVTWYNYFGMKSDEVEFTNSVRNGKGVSYHINGKVRDKFNYKEGELDGSYYRFFSTGDTSLVEYYKDGKLDGLSREYFMNGQLYASGMYKDGNQDGPWSFYFSNGNLNSKANYVDGKLNGEYKVFYHNGMIESTRNFNSADEIEGQLAFYNRNGELYLEEIYKNGVIVKVASINSKGERYAVSGDDEGTFSFVTYDINGRKLTEGQLNKGKSVGKWKIYYRNGQLKSEYEYADDQLNGDMISYYPNGKISVVTPYVNGQLEGKYIAYEKNGQVKTEGYYKNNNTDDNWFKYNSKGELEGLTYYLNGESVGYDYSYGLNGGLTEKRKLFQGKVLDYLQMNENGDTISYTDLAKESIVNLWGDDGKSKNCEINTLAGMFNGPLSWFYPNGNVLSKRMMEIGVAEGDYVRYYENGKPAAKGNYLNGEQTGIWEYYHENGAKEMTCNYYSDEKDSICTSWHENGQLKEKEEYFIGELQGDSYQYDDYGELMIKLIYDADELIGYQYKKQGTLCDTIYVKGGDFTIESYYDNGQKSYVSEYKDYLQNGRLIKYDSKGQLRLKKEMKDGMSDGITEVYYSNGTLKSRYTSIADLREGEEQQYYETGKLKKTINWKSDNEHGITTFYNTSGKVTRKVNYINGRFTEVKS
nr:tetratricopeptide repeat protein [uncultured Carboxylicivirga sp.]